MANTDMLTRNTVSKILGIENRTLQYWERKGLKSYRKRPYVMYRQEDIIKYMREHPEDWNAARVTDDTMFMRYDWYKEKDGMIYHTDTTGQERKSERCNISDTKDIP